MTKKRVTDYAALKARTSIRDVLLRYCDDLPAEGSAQLRIPCPLCEYGKNCLSVSLERNIFKCFHCQAQGNILDFVAAAEDVATPQAALLLGQWFPETKKPKKKKKTRKKKKQQAKEQVKTNVPEAVRENPVLGFALKNIDVDHEHLATLGLPDHVLKNYEIGFYGGRGMLRDSIVMPIRRVGGDLIGYLGFDAERQVVYPPEDKFDPRSDLFGADQLDHYIEDVDLLYVVKSPVDVLVCAAFGVPAVATMSATPSKSDLDAIRGMDCELMYLTRDDQDDREVGRICRAFIDLHPDPVRFQSLEQLFLTS